MRGEVLLALTGERLVGRELRQRLTPATQEMLVKADYDHIHEVDQVIGMSEGLDFEPEAAGQHVTESARAHSYYSS